MSQEQESLNSRLFTEFGIAFDVHIKDVYQSNDPRSYCLEWYAICGEQISPTRVVTLPYGGEQEIPPEIDIFAKSMAAKMAMRAVVITKSGEIIQISLFGGTKLESCDNLKWHPRLETFNEAAWREKSA